MVKKLLMITADLENVTNLQPQGGCDDANFPYYFKMKCSNCGEVSKKNSCVMLSEIVPHPNGRGTTNLVQKCKFCSREGTVTMIPGHGRPLMHDDSLSGKYTPLMMFDWGGLEPIDISCGHLWEAVSTGGNEIKCVDLSDGEFVDYLEEANLVVSVTSFYKKIAGAEAGVAA